MRVASLLAALLAGRAEAEKTDVVVLINGDHLTGEIKGMSRGQLDFKTDDAGRPSIEWVKIARVTSKHIFEVELGSGKKYYGTLSSPAEQRVQVGTEEADVFTVEEIINLTPMDEWFWARVKANLDLGFTLAKSNKALTLSGDGDFSYRGEHFGGAIDFNTYVQNDANSTAVGQITGTLTGTYFLERGGFSSSLAPPTMTNWTSNSDSTLDSARPTPSCAATRWSCGCRAVCSVYARRIPVGPRASTLPPRWAENGTFSSTTTPN